MADITQAPEMLGGRVKTLHPAVHGGILARKTSSDVQDMTHRGYDYIDLVFCNLYPFQKTIEKEGVSIPMAVEEIDIGKSFLVVFFILFFSCCFLFFFFHEKKEEI